MAKFVCTQCNKEYDQPTPDGFCTNQPDCEYGSGWLKEVKGAPASATDATDEATASAPEPEPIGFENEIGLCILMMDGSLSMGDLAFPTTDYPGDKFQLVSMNAAGGVWSLKNITQADNALIALCVFGGAPKLEWIKSVKEIVDDYGDEAAFGEYIRLILETKTPEPRTTNLNEALKLAHEIYQAYLKGGLSEHGGIKDFKPLVHKTVRVGGGQGEEDFISIPNARILIYTDGEHNVTQAVHNPFAEEEQSVLLSAFIGEEDGKGVKQMQKMANICPKHAPAQGFFLIHSPERIQTLKGLFRMASGASGFCPSCLLMEQAPAEEAAKAETLEPDGTTVPETVEEQETIDDPQPQMNTDGHG